MNTSNIQESSRSDNFLVFRSGGSLYGSPLGDLREAIPYRTPRCVPNTKKYFSGIVGVKGEVAGVVDLGVCFHGERLSSAASHPQILILLDSVAGLFAVPAEKIESVRKISAGEIDLAANYHASGFRDAVIGVAKIGDEIALLIDLQIFFRNLDVAVEQSVQRVS